MLKIEKNVHNKIVKKILASFLDSGRGIVQSGYLRQGDAAVAMALTAQSENRSSKKWV